MNRMVALAAKKYALMPFPTPQETPRRVPVGPFSFVKRAEQGRQQGSPRKSDPLSDEAVVVETGSRAIVSGADDRRYREFYPRGRRGVWRTLHRKRRGFRGPQPRSALDKLREARARAPFVHHENCPPGQFGGDFSFLAPATPRPRFIWSEPRAPDLDIADGDETGIRTRFAASGGKAQ